MDRKWLLSVALVFGVVSPTQAGLIPNGDFETGDFTDWGPQPGGTPGNGGLATVEFVDGSYRAVIKTSIGDGPGVSGGELLTSSDPVTWGNGKILQFDLSYEYAIDSVGGGVGIFVNASTSGVQILNLTQDDTLPLAGSSPMTTYSIAWDGINAFDLFPSAFTLSSGSVSLTVILDNVRIVPEPSTLVLTASALCALPLLVRARRRTCR